MDASHDTHRTTVAGEATPADLASASVQATDSYVPGAVPGSSKAAALHVPRFGLTVEDERYALARDGNQMFGVLTCNASSRKGWGLAIDLRSTDRSLAISLVSGSRVFVCDNLAFHGSRVNRKHRPIFPRPPDLMYRMLAGAIDEANSQKSSR